MFAAAALRFAHATSLLSMSFVLTSLGSAALVLVGFLATSSYKTTTYESTTF